MADEYLEGIMNRIDRDRTDAPRKPLIYLAGPDVFLPDAVEMGERKKRICATHGLTGLYPLDNDLSAESADVALSLHIYRANLGLMKKADAVIANLTPFRGPGADGGTVFELGYMIGRDKPVFGYSNVDTLYLEKAVAICGRWKKGDEFIDQDRMLVENFGLHDNLMIVHGAETNGGSFEVPAEGEVADDIWHDLRQFERSVERAAAYFAGKNPA
jgi:nucleoside 2-deoxyribosyltransferase